MMFIIILAFGILIFCVLTAIILAQKLPHKPNLQLELPLLNDADCSLEKVVLNLEIANNIQDVENCVQQKLL